MPNIRMLAIDLDRTLLRTDKTISPYTRAVLTRAHEQNIRIVYATARPRRTAVPITRGCPADAMIFHNGAVIDVAAHQIASAEIPCDLRDAVLRLLTQTCPDARIGLEIGDTYYVNFDPAEVAKYTVAVRSDFTDLPDMPAFKLLAEHLKPTEIAAVTRALPDTLYAEQTYDGFLMIMSRRAVKSEALRTLCAHFGIPLADVAAFGDDHNDTAMLKACGMGVAVANAEDAVKAAADEVCASNDCDGVAKWIDARLLAVRTTG